MISYLQAILILLNPKLAIASPITSPPLAPSTQQQPQTKNLCLSQLEPSSTASSLPTSPSHSPINQDMPSSSSADVRKEEEEQKRKEHYYNHTQPATIEEKKSSWVKSKNIDTNYRSSCCCCSSNFYTGI